MFGLCHDRAAIFLAGIPIKPNSPPPEQSNKVRADLPCNYLSAALAAAERYLLESDGVSGPALLHTTTI